MVKLDEFLSPKTMELFQNNKLNERTMDVLKHFESYQGKALKLNKGDNVEFDMDYVGPTINEKFIKYLSITDKGYYVIFDLKTVVGKDDLDRLFWAHRGNDTFRINIYNEKKEIKKYLFDWAEVCSSKMIEREYNDGHFNAPEVLDGLLFSYTDSEFQPTEITEFLWCYGAREFEYYDEFCILYKDDRYEIESFAEFVVYRWQKNHSIAESRHLEDLLYELDRDFIGQWVGVIASRIWQAAYNADYFIVDENYSFKVLYAEKYPSIVIVDKEGNEFGMDLLKQKILPKNIIYPEKYDNFILHRVAVTILFECLLNLDIPRDFKFTPEF